MRVQREKMQRERNEDKRIKGEGRAVTKGGTDGPGGIVEVYKLDESRVKVTRQVMWALHKNQRRSKGRNSRSESCLEF